MPILAVGLCYGLESEAVSLIAKYILMFVSMRSAPDDAIRAAFCHHCENYIALMEYYPPQSTAWKPPPAPENRKFGDSRPLPESKDPGGGFFMRKFFCAGTQ